MMKNMFFFGIAFCVMSFLFFWSHSLLLQSQEYHKLSIDINHCEASNQELSNLSSNMSILILFLIYFVFSTLKYKRIANILIIGYLSLIPNKLYNMIPHFWTIFIFFIILLMVECFITIIRWTKKVLEYIGIL